MNRLLSRQGLPVLVAIVGLVGAGVAVAAVKPNCFDERAAAEARESCTARARQEKGLPGAPKRRVWHPRTAICEAVDEMEAPPGHHPGPWTTRCACSSSSAAAP